MCSCLFINIFEFLIRDSIESLLVLSNNNISPNSLNCCDSDQNNKSEEIGIWFDPLNDSIVYSLRR